MKGLPNASGAMIVTRSPIAGRGTVRSLAFIVICCLVLAGCSDPEPPDELITLEPVFDRPMLIPRATVHCHDGARLLWISDSPGMECPQ